MEESTLATLNKRVIESTRSEPLAFDVLCKLAAYSRRTVDEVLADFAKRKVSGFYPSRVVLAQIMLDEYLSGHTEGLRWEGGLSMVEASKINLTN